MTNGATTIDEFLADLPDDRRSAIETVRAVMLDHLPVGYEENLQYGMLSYVVPLDRYPKTYNGQALTLASLGNQKRHMALYLMGVYGDEGSQQWLKDAWAKTGKKLDMGKSCLRFRSLDDLDLDLIGQAIARIPLDDFIAAYEQSRAVT